jgi:ABC-type phosphate transport system substrate-binding protein
MKHITFLAALFGAALVSRAEDIAFIAHPSLTEKAVTADEVKNILLNNKTKWSSGPAIKLVVLADGALHEKVIKDFAQRTPDQFDKYWKKAVFTGVGSMPNSAKTDADVIAYVAANPGAFGYVAKASVTDKVKVLAGP